MSTTKKRANEQGTAVAVDKKQQLRADIAVYNELMELFKAQFAKDTSLLNRCMLPPNSVADHKELVEIAAEDSTKEWATRFKVKYDMASTSVGGTSVDVIVFEFTPK